MREVNAPLLMKTLNFIEDHPGDQKHWTCGTTACFAGHAVLLDGGEIHPNHAAMAVACDDDPPDGRDGDAVQIFHRAMRILGLTERQAGDLFDAGNTLTGVQARVYRLVGDFDRLAELVEREAVYAINFGEDCLPNAFSGEDMDVEETHQAWGDLKDAIEVWQKAEDGEIDLNSVEPKWRDGETYAHETRRVVAAAIDALIGRTA